MNKNFFKSTKGRISTFLLLLSLASYGCISTEDLSGNKFDDTIEIEIRSADIRSTVTRAGSELQLRYTAILYNGSGVDASKLVQRTELLASSTEPLRFQVEEPGNYFVTVFADYIPLDAQKNTEGKYGDNFYCLSSNEGLIEMCAVKMNTKSTNKTFDLKDSNTHFNNDSYDCFSGTMTITKDDGKYEGAIILKRPVCKIKIVSTTGDASEIESIDLQGANFNDLYNFNTGLGTRINELSETSFGRFSNVKPVDPSNNVLITFYSFGSNQDYSPSQLKFTPKGLNGAEYKTISLDWTLDLKTLRANTIYTLKGDFLQLTKPGVEKSGEINISVSTDNEWDKTEKELGEN